MDDLDESKARDGMPDDINISDVIEVLATDPDFNPKPKGGGSAKMFNGGEIVAPRRAKPTCVIAEQPASKALRFRYECEGRSAGSIPGVNSTPENKTFPTIQVQGYQGRAVVVVSCVTKDPPYRPHPHNLVGREGCKRGVCTLEVPPETMTVTFSNLGIQCVKKKDIESALKVREEIRVDPFRTGYGHRSQPTSIDLNAVRLCFQVFLQGEPRSRYTDLTPVVSDPIYDKKAMADLVIVKLSDCVCPVDGGNKDIILLCEKISKEDIQVRFYEEKDGQVTWEGLGEFQPSQVHKQTAIWFKPPKYRTMDVREPVKVNIQLRRPSDGATSLSLPFQLLPLDAGIKRRGEKLDNDQNIKRIFRDIQERDVQDRNRKLSNLYVPQMNIPLEQNVKDEPNDASRSPYAHHYLDSVSPPQPYPSTSPLVNYYANYVHQPQNSLEPTLPPLPPCNQLLPNTTWNIPSTSYAGTNNLSELNLLVPETSTYLNMDTQQSEHSELRLISLNSGDLPDANPSDMNNLTENLSANLSLTDIQIPAERMTDSLDRLANNEFAKHYE